ncbi:MAG: AmmeMemoRadiSam system radical SAM enzyme [Thermoleophilia bacterium]|nr:AmmeMemoRadiSam system radical SAM enzyme [Thermoleophilia bacterium]
MTRERTIKTTTNRGSSSPEYLSGKECPGEALFWERLGPARFRCTLCPHRCIIEEGDVGLCKVRGVEHGRVVSLTYARPAIIVSDEIEKKPLFHFHPGTRVLSLGSHGCNVLCAGCQNWQLSHASPHTEGDRLPLLLPDDAVAMARKHKLGGVAFTYNEPVVWLEYVHHVFTAFKKAGLYTAFITAGYVSEAALDYIASVTDAFNFDLKAATAEEWSRFTKVKDHSSVLAAAIRAKTVHQRHVEVVTNVIPGINDMDASLRAIALWVKEHLGPDTPWHVTRFLPDFELSYLSPTPVRTLERAAALGKAVGLRFVYVGNVPGHPGRDTVCPSCGRTAIHRTEAKVRLTCVRDGRCAACGEDLALVVPGGV